MANEQDELLPDRATFQKRYTPHAAGARSVRGLHALLKRMPPEDSGKDAILAWLARVVDWLLVPGAEDRLELLVAVLRENPRLARGIGAALGRILDRGLGSRLFASTGLPARSGLVAEAGKRLMGKLLPEPPYDGDLSRVLGQLFPGGKGAELLLTLPSDGLGELLSLLGEPLEPLRRGLPEALLLLSARVAALGISDDLLERTESFELSSSPFLELPPACAALASTSAEAAEADAALERCLSAIEGCKAVVREVREKLEAGGVSLDLVYRLEMIGSGLERIRIVAELRHAEAARSAAPEARRRSLEAGRLLLATLVEGAAQEQSLRSLGRRNVELLSRKIVEHSGETGDHYITSSRGEYLRMLGSAGGGGVLTAGTTVAKFWIGGAKLPLLIEGFASTLNYAGSFVAMQLAGFTLATKQPSVTAAALARAIGKGEKDGNLSAWSEVVARITRSQLAAAMGNLGLVVPAALAIELFLRWSGRGPLLDAETAAYAIDSLHPLSSWTIPFAALTGVLLWLSSVAAGAAQNWSNYRRLPESIASVRWIRRLLGEKGCARLQRFVAKSVAGIGGNVSLGVFLAATPILGKLSGLLLDVRHVTLSTGSLAFAVAALGWESMFTPAFFAAVAGIGVIAMLNFGVSFALALWVARRSEGIVTGGDRRFLRALWKKLRGAPLDFVRPPPEAPRPAPGIEGSV